MKIKIFLIILLSLFVLSSSFTLAQKESQCFIDDHNVAIKGYDAVSYFTTNKAVKGSEKHTVTFDNASFYFASNDNKELFEKNPMKYMPQYGGYCAFGMGAKNMKVPSNPETFEVIDGKLFLFFNDKYEGKQMNTKMMWDKDQDNIHTMADANWKKQIKITH
jgi:YHS domain-containing protein